ncbi:hypothetical protein [Undibacterium sp. Ji49W]|uniref:hypothetical protein n=1 Tax=Undibacterium sp. Ji49W TaxID=3413040 RepID=UPI003BF235C6
MYSSNIKCVLFQNEELLKLVSGGDEEQTGKRMTKEEKDEYDEQQAREAAAEIRRETRGTTGQCERVAFVMPAA